jgi:glycosyltransferase involved in cell wall biosynthesis
MWGYSWDLTKDSYKNNIYLYDNKYSHDNDYFVLNYYLKNLIIPLDNQFNINRLNIDDLTNKLKNIICFKYNQNNYLKKKVVNIMGLFFTGGIERYLYYLDKYGNHDKYNYYLLYISNDSYVYEINNMKMISFDWNHNILNKLLINITPNVIIDHYSLYLQDNSEIYKNINNMNIIYFVHSAICYKNNISNLNIKKSIHLYNETEKEESWNNILENYYVTLGTELSIKENILPSSKLTNNKSNNNKLNNNKSIHISIIGRIAEEKIPLTFFEKLCILSKTIYPHIIINIYGEKDIKFNGIYVEQFDKLILDSSIKFNSFVNPLNMDEIYEKTDILLIPSKFETGSFTCIEAFSHGIPVFARNVFGLKYLIKNNITGYLFENDDEILNIIKNITHKSIFLNKNYREIIKKESLKYNIIDKINDLENIINLNISEKNIVIITSVLNCVNKPLSYYHIRTIFTLKERYKQTLKTIYTIKKYIPNVEILFCECSNLSMDEGIEIENNIKDNVNYYYNFYNDDIIKDSVNSMLKGLGEFNIMMEGIKILKSFNITYKNIFKISGRYYLNNHFDYNLFNCNNNNVFTYWDNSIKSYCTIFYKIDNNSLDLFNTTLFNLKTDLEKGESIEYILCKNFKYNVKIIDAVNVSGFLATEGYLFSI